MSPATNASEPRPTIRDGDTYRAAVVHGFGEYSVADGCYVVPVPDKISSEDAALRDVFTPHAAGMTKVTSEIQPLDSINDGIADLEAERVTARIVLTP